MLRSFFHDAVRRSALALFCLATLWWTSLILLGGIETRFFGHSLSSHEPMRPLLIAALMFAIFVLTGGDDVVGRLIARTEARVARATVAGKERAWRLIVATLVIAVVGLGIAFGSKVAGGADSYGYLSEAELLLSGHLSVPQPWVRDVPWPDPRAGFAPLGYIPAPGSAFSIAGYAPHQDRWSIVPTYSPGLPMLMAIAKFFGGNPALFLVVPICGGLMVLATFGIGRRLGSSLLGAIAAFLVATSPPFLEYALTPMSDVPTAAGWTLAWWGALGRTIRSAWAAALAVAIAIVIRPDRAPLAAAIVLWPVICAWLHPSDRRLHVWRGLVIVSGVVVGAATVALFYWHLYGSPLTSGYDPGAGLFAPTFFLQNLSSYAAQLSSAQSPFVFFGVAALLWPSRRLWPAAHRPAVIVLTLFTVLVWAEFSLINKPAAWIRFLLPSYGPIMIGVAAMLLLVLRQGWRSRLAVVSAGLVLLGALGIDGSVQRGIYKIPAHEALYFGFVEQIAADTPQRSIVFATQHSGSVRYYAGRMTLRWDQIPSDWLDRTVAWLGEHDIHVYAALDTWEVDMMKTQFAGQATVAKLDAPIFKISQTSFYDLGAGPASTQVLPTPPKRLFGLAPVAPPTISWER